LLPAFDAPLPGDFPWRRFNGLLGKWLATRCAAAGFDVHPEGVSDPARFETLPDGSLRVVLNFYAYGARLDDDGCVAGVRIPEDVVGWAYVITPDGDGAVLSVADARTRPDLPVCELIVRRANG
jgi:hypothetical protein